jgi:hypothetical protein
MRSFLTLAAPLAATVALVTCAAVLGAPLAEAQRRRRPRNIPFEGTVVQWSLFVSPHGSIPAQRAPITGEASRIPIPETSYDCSYGAPNRIAISAQNWSETRTLECRFGTTVVSTSGFCQVSGTSWGPRAAVLYLTEGDATERLEVSIDCAVQVP